MINYVENKFHCDPSVKEDVQECLDYLLHGRWGSDPDEDPYYLELLSQAFRHEFGMTNLRLELNGWKPGQNKDADYAILMSLCKLLCPAHGITFVTIDNLIGDIARENAS